MATLESEIPIGHCTSLSRHRPCAHRYRRDAQRLCLDFPEAGTALDRRGGSSRRSREPEEDFRSIRAGEKGLAPWKVPQPVGHPLPLFSEHNLAKDDRESIELVSGRALLVGDAAHLVDPLFGEGIYYAVRSGQLAAESILNQVNDRRRSLADYEEAVRREIYEEFRVAVRMASIRLFVSASLPPPYAPLSTHRHALLRRAPRA